MGFSLNKIANVGSLGVLGDDFTGSKAAATAASDANALASQSETAMFDKNMAFQKEQWDYQKGLQAPWQAAGQRGLQGYENLLQNPNQITSDPGYQFGMDQGMKGVGNSASASGMSLSGNTLKGLTQYGQDYAGTKYGDALNRQMGLASFGQGATQQLMQGSQGFSQGMGNLYQGQGQNLSNMYMNQGQIDANKATAGFNNMMGVANLGMSAYGMGSMMSGGGGGGTVGGGGSMMGGGYGSSGPNSGLYNNSAYSLY